MLTHQTLEPEGAEVPRAVTEHGAEFWGGNRLGVTPGGALPAETGHRHSWWGRHLVIAVKHEVSQARVEKFKGEQFYNLKETGNT